MIDNNNFIDETIGGGLAALQKKQVIFLRPSFLGEDSWAGRFQSRGELIFGNWRFCAGVLVSK